MHIDQYILKERKNRWKNIAMVWIDYRKAHDMGSKILDYSKSENVQNIREIMNFIMKAMKNWKLELTAEGNTLAEVNIYSDLPGICTFTMIICNSKDTIQLHT